MQMLNSWFELSFQVARLGWEAQRVMTLRLMRLAHGGVSGLSEAHLMIAEKVAAVAEAQTTATTVAINGGNGHQVAKKVVGVFKKRVRENKRRLSK
jgi:hypothetical protein